MTFFGLHVTLPLVVNMPLLPRGNGQISTSRMVAASLKVLGLGNESLANID